MPARVDTSSENDQSYTAAVPITDFEALIQLCPAAHAWLGQAGLYSNRFDAVCNFEQSVSPVFVDELFNLASKQVLSQLN